MRKKGVIYWHIPFWNMECSRTATCLEAPTLGFLLSCPHPIELDVGAPNLANLLEENEPQVLGHRYAQRALVGRHGGVLAPFAFCKSRGCAGRVETDA